MTAERCACGQHERGTRLYDNGWPTESHWGDYCDLANGSRFMKGDTLFGVPAVDNGKALALSLVTGSIERAEALIESLRQTMDHDEGGEAFRVAHNEHARCRYVPNDDGRGNRLICHCGLGDSIRECADVLDELRQARQQIARLEAGR